MIFTHNTIYHLF